MIRLYREVTGRFKILLRLWPFNLYLGKDMYYEKWCLLYRMYDKEVDIYRWKIYKS